MTIKSLIEKEYLKKIFGISGVLLALFGGIQDSLTLLIMGSLFSVISISMLWGII